VAAARPEAHGASAARQGGGAIRRPLSTGDRRELRLAISDELRRRFDEQPGVRRCEECGGVVNEARTFDCATCLDRDYRQRRRAA
jgi:hypothetical protein